MTESSTGVVKLELGLLDVDPEEEAADALFDDSGAEEDDAGDMHVEGGTDDSYLYATVPLSGALWACTRTVSERGAQ